MNNSLFFILLFSIPQTIVGFELKFIVIYRIDLGILCIQMNHDF